MALLLLTLRGIRERHGALLFVRTGESTANLITAKHGFLLLLFISSFVVSFYRLYSRFVILYLKENKRARWRSLICAKRRNIR